MSLPIPPSDGSDQRQPNDASKRDIAKASVYGYSAMSRVLGLELPMPIVIHSVIPLHNTPSILDHQLTAYMIYLEIASSLQNLP